MKFYFFGFGERRKWADGAVPPPRIFGLELPCQSLSVLTSCFGNTGICLSVKLMYCVKMI